MSSSDRLVEKGILNDLIAGLGLSESACNVLKNAVEDLCDKVADPRCENFLISLFQYCINKKAGSERDLFDLRTLENAAGDAAIAVEQARALTSEGFMKAGGTVENRILLWDMIQQFVEIVRKPENEEKRKEEVEKLIRRMGELPLRQEGATEANKPQAEPKPKVEVKKPTPSIDRLPLHQVVTEIDKNLKVLYGKITNNSTSEQRDQFDRLNNAFNSWRKLENINMEQGTSFLVVDFSERPISEALAVLEQMLIDLRRYSQSLDYVSLMDSSLTPITHIVPELSQLAPTSSSAADASVVDLNPAYNSAPASKEYVETGIGISPVSGSTNFDTPTSTTSAVKFSEQSVVTSSPLEHVVVAPSLPEFFSTLTPIKPNTSLSLGPDLSSINSDPWEYVKENDQPEDHIFLTPSHSDSDLIDLHFDGKGREEDKDTFSPSYSDEEELDESEQSLSDQDGTTFSLHTYNRGDHGTEMSSTAWNGETAVFPSPFDDILFDEVDRLLVDDKSKKENPSFDVIGWDDFLIPNDEKKITTKKKEGAGKEHTPHKPKLTNLGDDYSGSAVGGEVFDEDPLNYFMLEENQPPEAPHRRDGDEFDPFNLLPKRNRIRNNTKDAVDKALAGVGQLFPIDEEEFSVSGGGAIGSAPDPLAPAVTTSTASGPDLPLESSKKHLVTGRPPLYYALKDVYDLLERPEVFKLEKSECFKYLSIPRMKMYLEKLKEIKGNAALTVAGSVLWDTLNPDKPNFRAEQLLEVLAASGKNILEEAIEKHQKPYFEQIKKALTEPAVRKYELAGKCFYIESKDGVIYLMLKDGANPSDEELKEAIREYQVVCEDMSNKTDAKAYLLDEPFTRNKANQQKIATIMTRFGMELANDNTVQESNKAVHKAVHEFSKKMKDPISLTAEDKTKDKVTEEARLNYRVMTSEGCLIPEGESAREPERIQYLDTISQWEKKPEWSYLNSVSILNDVLPELDVTTYKKEKVLAQVYPLSMDGKLEHEIKRRTTQRELHNKEEMQLQEAIKRSLQTAAAEADDATWLEEDCNAAKTEAEAFTKTVRAYEGNEESDYARAVQESLKTYLEEHYTIQDVPGDGNCFYRAVEDQMKQQGIHNFNQNEVELHTSLRLLVQGRNFTNGEWAGVHQLFALVEKAKVVIAVMDTRYPYLGFRCYYRDRQGNIAETYDSAELKRQQADQTIIHLAYTGGHYMSVREYQGLDKGAIQGTWNVAEPLQSRSTAVDSEPQPEPKSALASKQKLFPSSTVRAGQGSKRPSLPPKLDNASVEENVDPNSNVQLPTHEDTNLKHGYNTATFFRGKGVPQPKSAPTSDETVKKSSVTLTSH